VIALLSGVEGCVQALGVPAVQSAVAQAAPEGRAAAAQGLAGAGNLTMGAITAFSAGPIYGNLGPEWMFCIAATVGAALTVLAMLKRATRSTAS
jgi:MFS family permease